MEKIEGRRKTGNNVWKKLKTNKWVYITWYGSQGNIKYDVRLTLKRNEGGKSIKKGFTSKTRTLDYAIKYMKAHPKG